MLRKIDRILMRVPNLSGAVNYYRDVMGLKLLRQDARLASLAFADGGGELVLHVDPDLPGEAVYYLVDDVRALHAKREELKLHFVSGPSAVARGYAATVKDPFGNVLMILDRTAEDSARVEDGVASGGGLFAGVEQRVPARRELLVKLYEKIGRTADDLPYTPHFESIYNAYVTELPEPNATRGEVWRHLLNLRKAGKLPKLGDARSAPPEVTGEQRQKLREMLGEDVGRRDRLPYSQRFDALVDEFNKALPRKLSPHLVWRLVATLAK